MNGRRLQVGILLSVFLLGILAEYSEARPRFRRSSFFGRSPSQAFFFSPRVRFATRRFPRQRISRFRPFVFSPVQFANPSVPIAQPSQPSLPIHSDPSLPGNPVPIRPIDPNPPVRPTPTPGVEKLSGFCEASCPTEEFDLHYCWVPRSGQLTIVPFSYEGTNLCRAMRGLCRDIRATGQDPDSHPFVCKEKRSDTVVIRHDPEEESGSLPGTPVPSFPKDLGRVKGSVVRHTGDFMPGFDEGDSDRGKLKVAAIPNGKIFVFQGELAQKRRSDGFFIPRAVDTLGKKPVKVTTADEKGEFQVDLPPGTYTIVAEIDGELRHTDGGYPRYPNKTWGTVTVSQGNQSDYVVVDDQTTH